MVLTSQNQVKLSDVSLRYYYTKEGSSNQKTYIDNAGLSLKKAPWYVDMTSAVSSKVVNVSENEYYIELSFSGDQEIGDGEKLEMGFRSSKEDWTDFDQTNDTSYKNGPQVYYRGQKVES